MRAASVHSPVYNPRPLHRKIRSLSDYKTTISMIRLRPIQKLRNSLPRPLHLPILHHRHLHQILLHLVVLLHDVVVVVAVGPSKAWNCCLHFDVLWKAYYY